MVAILDLEAELFRVLSHPVRLRILELLAEGERSVGELRVLAGSAAGAPVHASATSQHLAALRREGLVESRKYRGSVLYRIRDGRANDLRALARELICSRLEDDQALLGRLVEEQRDEQEAGA